MLRTKAAGAAGHTWADARVSGQLAEPYPLLPKCEAAGSGQVRGTGERPHRISFSFREKQKEYLNSKKRCLSGSLYSLARKTFFFLPSENKASSLKHKSYFFF